MTPDTDHTNESLVDMDTSRTEPDSRHAASRLDRFETEMAEMRIETPHSAQDARMLRLGTVMVAAGILVGVVAVVMSLSTGSEFRQRDAIVVGVAGVPLSIGGAAVYLRFGMTRFLRLWLARAIVERK